MTEIATLALNSLNDVRDLGPLLRRGAFWVAVAMCLTPWATPPVALAAGVILALTVENPFSAQSKRVSKWLLQACVVLLGFGMDLGTVVHAGAGGIVFAAGTILATLSLGWGLGRLLKIAPQTSMLISCGTAICGGSAIAAVGSAIGGAEAEMTVALGTVFILNAVALYLFPVIGHALHLSQGQFGTWAGVAIHDVSSVVGAASRYGLPALQVATAVKLSRALWIVPVSIGAGMAFKGEGARGRVQIPWFIGLFVLASLLRTVLPGVAHAAPTVTHLATIGLTVTLFLIGAGLSATMLKSIGWRPLVQGAVLWVFVSGVSLVVVLKMVR